MREFRITSPLKRIGLTNYDNFSSLGRLDMARGPRHPTLREATLTTAFILLKEDAFNHNFSVKKRRKKKEEGFSYLGEKEKHCVV
ncbi:MAG: hypothetical protein F6K18_00405 [Okeania sp. SIO2C2]|uniref:hypothetical protein n=1 Tax=Okeania sp. SIO2C2 TaxID=2607787 RepID=UPI0013BB07FE|nr:hypothetical protein [Okeania sp. SIO2C2]NEP85409.1 hypothetical protein [Okeania sp. SIO2C2]